MSGQQRVASMTIRRPLPEDVPGVRAAHAALAASDEFTFGFELDELSDEGWLAQLDREARGIDLPAHLVRASFLVGLVAGQVVGRVSVRHELNEMLAWYGGHIGYGVIPSARGRGHATALAQAGLALLAEEGTDTALLTCEATNAASIATIVRVGGVFRDEIELADGQRAHRYDVVTG
jgi:predicted acetyltransferase